MLVGMNEQGSRKRGCARQDLVNAWQASKKVLSVLVAAKLAMVAWALPYTNLVPHTEYPLLVEALSTNRIYVWWMSCRCAHPRIFNSSGGGGGSLLGVKGGQGYAGGGGG